MTTTCVNLRVDVYAPVFPAVPMLRQAMLAKAGGVSSYRCIGSFIMPDGKECKELTDVHTIFIEDSAENQLWLEDLLLTYKRLAQQQSVLYVLNGHLAHFITA